MNEAALVRPSTLCLVRNSKVSDGKADKNVNFTILAFRGFRGLKCDTLKFRKNTTNRDEDIISKKFRINLLHPNQL